MKQITDFSYSTKNNKLNVNVLITQKDSWTMWFWLWNCSHTR